VMRRPSTTTWGSQLATDEYWAPSAVKASLAQPADQKPIRIFPTVLPLSCSSCASAI
jgi:hypothetical protein